MNVDFPQWPQIPGAYGTIFFNPQEDIAQMKKEIQQLREELDALRRELKEQS